MQLHSRSLLSSEALEQHLGVAVDAQVLDGLGILRGAGRILPGRRLGERRAQRVAEGLHRGYGTVTKAERGEGAGIVKCVGGGGGFEAAAHWRDFFGCSLAQFPTSPKASRPRPTLSTKIPRPPTSTPRALRNESRYSFLLLSFRFVDIVSNYDD